MAVSSFFIKCNYDINLFEASFPLCYRDLLGHFQELCSTDGGEPRGKFILWNKDITIDKKPLFWETWLERGI